MEKIFSLFSLLLLTGIVGVNSLQCYVCFNCTTPGDEDLRTCGEPITTTLPPTFPTTTGIPSSPSTTTTSSTASTTTPSTTTPSTTTPSTTTPSTTTTSTTTPSTTTPSSTTTSSTTPSTKTTSTTTPTTTTTTEAIVYPVDPPVEPPVSPEPESRLKRSAMSPPASRVSKFEDIEYVCYKVTADMNNETVIERGCAPAVINDKTLCENDIVKNVTTSCSSCNTDKCNSSYTVQFSTALLASAVVGLLFCK